MYFHGADFSINCPTNFSLSDAAIKKSEFINGLIFHPVLIATRDKLKFVGQKIIVNVRARG